MQKKLKRCSYVFLTSGPTNITENKDKKTNQQKSQQNVVEKRTNLNPFFGNILCRSRKKKKEITNFHSQTVQIKVACKSEFPAKIESVLCYHII